MNLYEAKTYREFVKACLAQDDKRRGAVKKLALQLKCHSTYVSQVTKGKADFSNDQAISFCKFYKLSTEQSEFFIDLLSRDRAANKDTKAHFQQRIDRRRHELLDMKKRWQIAASLTAEQENKYYSSWTPQAVHVYCQMPGFHNVQMIARDLKLAESQVTAQLQILEQLGFVESSSKGYYGVRDSVHLGRDSDILGRNHANWRLKAIADITESGALPGTHYSSIISMSAASAERIKNLILKHIDLTRDEIMPSPPEGLYVYNLDFYPLLAQHRQNP